MRVVDLLEAKAHLSRLIERAAKGEPFLIARFGKPLVKVVALDAPSSRKAKRLGFLKGKIAVPEDFDRMGTEAINRVFRGPG